MACNLIDRLLLIDSRPIRNFSCGGAQSIPSPSTDFEIIRHFAEFVMNFLISIFPSFLFDRKCHAVLKDARINSTRNNQIIKAESFLLIQWYSFTETNALVLTPGTS